VTRRLQILRLEMNYVMLRMGHSSMCHLRRTQSQSARSPSKRVSSYKAAGDIQNMKKDDKVTFGMMGSHQKPLKDSSKLEQDDDEECQEVYTDFATGDELCWP
jgi:hypothetical protein